MHVEVIRTPNSFSIQWTSGDDLWTVAKKFNLGSRTLEPAEIECSAGVPGETDQAHATTVAVALAERMDHIFTRPEDFDRVQISYDHTDDGTPAWIKEPVDGKIYIVKAPKPEALALARACRELAETTENAGKEIAAFDEAVEAMKAATS